MDNPITTVLGRTLGFMALTVLCISAMGQSRVPTVEEIWGEYKFHAKGAGLNFLPDGKHYVKTERNEKGEQMIVSYEIASGEVADTLFHSKWVPSSDTVSPFRFQNYKVSESGEKVLLKTELERIYRRSRRAYHYVWDREEGELIAVSDKSKQEDVAISPSGDKIAFVRQNNLYVRDLSTGEVSAITTDGQKNKIINGATDWVYEEEFAFTKAFEWSPDGEKIAYYKFDEGHVRQISMPMYRGLYPHMKTFKYPKAGERNSFVKLFIHHLEDDKRVKVDVSRGMPQYSAMDTPRNDKSWEYIPRIQWTGNPDKLSIQRMDRHQSRLDLLLADANTGETRNLFTERSQTYIGVDNDLTFLKDEEHFLWTSDRSGYNHIYLYNVDGEVVRQVTKGKWPVTNFIGINGGTKTLYFKAAKTSPLQRHIYSITLEGEEMKKLTSQEGMHRIDFSPDFQYYTHSYSGPNTPPVVSLEKREGETLRVLENNQALKDTLEQYQMSQKEFFSFQTSQDVKLNGWMIKPPNFDPSKDYPVLMYVYGGPGSQTVQKRWGGSNYVWYQKLANEGYIIASVDNRGTGARGRQFKKMTYKKLSRYEVMDQKEAAQYLGEKDYVDQDRIGIWGWSYGGYMSTLSILRGAEVFDMAMAVAPVFSWRFYDTIYTERFMQTPQDNPEGYRKGSAAPYVDSLKGDYLLVHGTADDNVHFQNSAHLINRLVTADQQFELMVYPNRAHGMGGGNARKHLYDRMTRFVLEEL